MTTKEELDRLYPRPEDIPGCLSLLDDFLSCNLLSAQVKSLYRYGHLSVCAHKLEEFKFCMSIKSLHPYQKRDLWIRRRADGWSNRRIEKSSEDVWQLRTEPLVNYPPRPQQSNASDTIG